MWIWSKQQHNPPKLPLYTMTIQLANAFLAGATKVIAMSYNTSTAVVTLSWYLHRTLQVLCSRWSSGDWPARMPYATSQHHLNNHHTALPSATSTWKFCLCQASSNAHSLLLPQKTAANNKGPSAVKSYGSALWSSVKYAQQSTRKHQTEARPD